LLLFAPAGGHAAQDTVLARYFASHGYVVVVVAAGRTAAAGLEEALGAARTLLFVDSTRVAVAGAGAGATAARQLAEHGTIGALAELRPIDGPPPPAAGGRIATLIVRDPTDRPTPADGRRLTVTLPAGLSDRVRLVTAVTHAFLNAALGRGSLSSTDLTRRLRAAGLAVCCLSNRD
jgi:dienelactone hydrolase